jgi:hypothetical protein
LFVDDRLQGRHDVIGERASFAILGAVRHDVRTSCPATCNVGTGHRSGCSVQCRCAARQCRST